MIKKHDKYDEQEVDYLQHQDNIYLQIRRPSANFSWTARHWGDMPYGYKSEECCLGILQPDIWIACRNYMVA